MFIIVIVSNIIKHYSTTINFRKQEMSIHISIFNVQHYQKYHIAQNSTLIFTVLAQIKYDAEQLFFLINIIKE